MHPILFKIPLFGGLTIFTYGVLVATGFLAGIYVVTREARRVGEDPAKALDLLFWVIVAAIIGSRVYYVLTIEFDTILSDPLSFFKIWRGGLVFQGGVIGAFIVGFWWIRKHKLPLWKWIDMFTFGIPLGHAIGRLGCFMAGCCHGRPAPNGCWWAVTFPDNVSSFAPPGIPLYPTQLMESFGEFAIFAFLYFVLRKRKTFEGEIMSVYLFLYAILRFVVEMYRGGETRTFIFGWFSAAQLVSIIMVAFAAFIWINNRNRYRLEGR